MILYIFIDREKCEVVNVKTDKEMTRDEAEKYQEENDHRYWRGLALSEGYI